MTHRNGLEGLYTMVNHRRLRYGYTTGSCAAAASRAAAEMLFGGTEVDEVAIETPKGIRLCLLTEEVRIDRDEKGNPVRVHCGIRKDGGDDADATDGLLICADIERIPQSDIRIDGGIGVGRVTKPGLDQPPGNAAINSVPRAMIRKELTESCRAHGYDGGLSVIISVPEGREAAAKTFNGRLGIEGGISILGTSGIVMPMSEEAFVRSIRAEMKALLTQGGKYLVISPGNYGETFSKTVPDLDLTFFMKCSNFVGQTMDMAEDLGVEGILFVAHIGKFIKVSGGIMNTHSRNADARLELMSAAAIREGADLPTARKILASNTTEEALQILREEDADLFHRTMNEINRKALYYLDHRCRGTVKTGLILFSSEQGLLSQSPNVPEMKRILMHQRAAV